jgi:hypothetical protein
MPSLTRSSARHVVRRLDGASSDRALAVAATALLAEAEELLSRVRAAAKRAPKKTLALPGKSKAERREEHAGDTGKLRADVWTRAGGTARWDPEADDGAGEWVCEGEARDEVYGTEITSAAWDLHHLRGGGERRSRQSPDNCLALAWDTHRLIHRGHVAALKDVKAACIRLGMKDGLRATEHRIAKCEEARR